MLAAECSRGMLSTGEGGRRIRTAGMATENIDPRAVTEASFSGWPSNSAVRRTMARPRPSPWVRSIKLLKAVFENPDEEIPWQQKKRFDDFDFGYALTVHKAQGSQWNEVVLFDESFAFKETRQRWLYTAITRAAERLTVVR